MTSAAPQKFTVDEYLALERASETKHEYVAGSIVAMAGARPAHNMLAANTTAALRALARRAGCVIMTSDQRVHVPPTQLYTYPDVTVACGERRYTDEEPPSLLNPTILVEVTSDTSEEYDRGTKFVNYQAIPALREYVIVSHREHRIDHHRRLDSGQWLVTSYTNEGAGIELPALGASISLSDVYDDVDLDEGRADASPKEQ